MELRSVEKVQLYHKLNPAEVTWSCNLRPSKRESSEWRLGTLTLWKRYYTIINFLFPQKYLNKETNNVPEALFGIQKQIAPTNLSYELITFAQNLKRKWRVQVAQLLGSMFELDLSHIFHCHGTRPSQFLHCKTLLKRHIHSTTDVICRSIFMQVPTRTFQKLIPGPHICTFWAPGRVPAGPSTQQVNTFLPE